MSPTFKGVNVDPILRSLAADPDFPDTRLGFVFSAKPPVAIRNLVTSIQQAIGQIATRE